MMNWLKSLFAGQPSSAQVAKDRLKVVLSYDRANMNPELLERVKNDIVNAISEHIEIDRAGIKITTEHGETGEHLVADIPIRSTRGAAAQTESAPAFRPPPPSMPRRDYPMSKRKKRRG